MTSIYNFFKIKLCFRTYWRQWLLFLIITLLCSFNLFSQSNSETSMEKGAVEVPFAVIEEVPIFPGCEIGNNLEKRNCMSKKIAIFIQRKFNTDLASDLGLTGRIRISVIFKIDQRGNIVGVRARAPHLRLQTEAIRVVSMLPKMKPGIQRGKAVIVPYSLPIIFEIPEDADNDEENPFTI